MGKHCEHDGVHMDSVYLCTKCQDVQEARTKALEAVVKDIVDYFEADYDQPEFYERAVEALKEKE